MRTLPDPAGGAAPPPPPPPWWRQAGRTAGAWAAKHRRPLILVAIVLLLIGATSGYLAWRYVEHRLEVRDTRLRAFVAYTSGDHATAQTLLRRYLRERPLDQHALQALGVSQLSTARTAAAALEAVGALEAALELDPRSYETRRTLLQAYLRIDHVEEALKLAEDLFNRYPRDPLPFIVLTQVDMRRGQFGAALARADGVLAGTILTDEMRDAAMLAKSRSLLAQGRLEDAAHWAEQLVKVSASNLEAQELYLNVSARLGRSPDELTRHARRLLDAHPEVVINQLLYAMACRAGALRAAQSGDTETAERLQQASMDQLAQVAKEKLTPVELRLLLGELQQVDGPQRVLNLLSDQIGRDDAPWVLLEFCRRSVLMGNHDAMVARLATAAPDAADLGPELLGLLALAQQRRGDTASAEQQAARLAAAAGDDPLARAWLVVLAQHGLKPESAPPDEQAVAALRDGLAKDPTSPFLHYILGGRLLRAGAVSEARQALGRAAAWAPYWAAPVLELARSMRASGEAGAALELANAAVRRQPDLPEPRIERLVSAAAAAGLLDDATVARLLGELEGLLGQAPTLAPLLGPARIQFMARQDRIDEAAAQWDELLALGDPPLPLLLALWDLDQRMQLGRRDAWLEAAQRYFPHEPAVAMAAAASRLGEGLNVALAVFDAAWQAAAPTDAWAWEQRRMALIERSDPAEALRRWRLLVEPADAPTYVLATAMESDAVWMDPGLVGAVLDRLEPALAHTDAFRLRRANYRLRFTADPVLQQAAAADLNLMVEAAPEQATPEALTLLADWSGAHGDTERELELLSRTARRRPTDAGLHLRLAERLRASGRDAAARQLVAAVQQVRSPDPLTTAWGVAQFLVDSNDAAAALDTVERAYRGLGVVEPIDGRLARLALAAGLPERARAQAQLLERRGGATDLAEAIRLYRTLGDAEAAKRAAATLQHNARGNGAALVLLGELAFEAGDGNGAIAAFEAAAAADPSQAGAWRALIRIALASGDTSTATQRVVAAAEALQWPGLRRLAARPALLEAASKRPELRPLLDQFLEPTAPPEAVEVLALAYAAWQDRPQGQALAQATAEAADALPQMPLACRMAIDAFAALNDWPAAAARADRLLMRLPQDAGAAEQVAVFAARMNRHADAARYARVWLARSADPTPPLLFLTDVLAAAGPAERTPERLRPVLELLGAPESRPQVAQLVLARMLRARSMTWAMSEVAPRLRNSRELRQAWMNVAGELEATPSAARAWLAAVQPAMPEPMDDRERLAYAQMLMALWQNTAETAYAEQFAQQIGGITVDSPLRPEADFALGSMHLLRGELEEGEGLLRRTLEARPDHLGALNNLAVLLLSRPGGFEEARVLASRARRLAPDHPSVLDTYAMILAGDGHEEEALALVEAALAKTPDNAEIRLQLAELNLRLGRHEVAMAQVRQVREQLQRAARLNPLIEQRLSAFAAALGTATPSRGPAANPPQP